MSRARLIPKTMSNKVLWGSMGNGYNIHRLMWTLFPEMEENMRNFIYRQETDGKFPTFYLVSENEPKDDSGIWDINVKHYDPVLRSGQKLAFSLRANPIVTKRDENRRQHRHDVVMNEKRRLRLENDGNVVVHVPDIVQDKGVEWLKRKADNNGFLIEDGQVRADGYQTHRYYKPKGKHYVNISTIDFNGVLTVTDSELFKKTLYVGIGPAKGFGCGLLLVRPFN